MGYFLYIVECADGSLYTGIAIDVARRLKEHNGEAAATAKPAKTRRSKARRVKGRGARYTASRRPVRLVYQAPFPSRSAAMKAEIWIKRLSRMQKQGLIAAGTVSGEW